jgi:hypothetical protein
VSSEDVLGKFEVKDGRIVEGSYRRNGDQFVDPSVSESNYSKPIAIPWRA